MMGISFQYWYKNDILTIFPTSSADAIIAAGNGAPANNFAMPVTENTAAHIATNVAVNEVTVINDLRVFIRSLSKNTAEVVM